MAKKKKKKSKKTVAQRKTYPELLLLAACDGVSRDPNTGKPTLYGIFDLLAVTKLPATAPPFTVFAKLFGGSGEHDIGLKIVGPKGEKVQDSSEIAKVKCKPSSGVILQMSIQGLTFSKLGPHRIHLVSGRKRLGRPCSIFVQKKRAEKKR